MEGLERIRGENEVVHKAHALDRAREEKRRVEVHELVVFDDDVCVVRTLLSREIGDRQGEATVTGNLGVQPQNAAGTRRLAGTTSGTSPYPG